MRCGFIFHIFINVVQHVITDVLSTVMPSTPFKLNVLSFWPLRSTVWMPASGPNLTVTNRLWFACNHSRANILSIDALFCGALPKIKIESHCIVCFFFSHSSSIYNWHLICSLLIVFTLVLLASLWVVDVCYFDIWPHYMRLRCQESEQMPKIHTNRWIQFPIQWNSHMCLDHYTAPMRTHSIGMAADMDHFL